MSAEELARVWIEAWNAGEPQRIPLAEAFTHTSPFGTIEGRDAYLEFMAPMVGSGPALTVVRSMGDDTSAVIHYDMETAAGPLPCCDWVDVADGEIVAVHSFYDATNLR